MPPDFTETPERRSFGYRFEGMQPTYDAPLRTYTFWAPGSPQHESTFLFHTHQEMLNTLTTLP